MNLTRLTQKSLVMLGVSLLAIQLIGCQAVVSRVTACVPLQEYSLKFQLEAGKELLEIMDTQPRISQMINDFGVSRELIRACLEKQNTSG